MQYFLKNDMLINSKQISGDSSQAALASDWLVFFSFMAQMKITPRRGGEEEARESENEGRGTCPTLRISAPVDPQCLRWKPLQPK